jgi:hypothetical protein
MTSPMHMPKRRNDHAATVTVHNLTNDATVTADLTNDLPLSMQPGWDPLTPGREAQSRFLNSCIAEGVDPREVDPDGYWSDQF